MLVTYHIYKNGEEVLETDSIEEAARKMEISTTTVTSIASTQKETRKGFTVSTEDLRTAKKRRTAKSIIERLKMYGNTCVEEEDIEDIDKLKERGVDFTVRKVAETKDIDGLCGPQTRGKIKYFYVLELVQ